MSHATMEELIRLPEESAVQTYFDGLNTTVARRLAAVFSAIGVVLFIESLGQNEFRHAAILAGGLLSALLFFLGRNTRFFERNNRAIVLALLIVSMMVVVSSFPDPEPAFAFAGFVYPSLLVLFRLRAREYLAVAAMFSSTAIWLALAIETFDSRGAQVAIILTQLIVAFLATRLASSITRRKRSAFLARWRVMAASEQESTRMRSELNDARAIQLAMLPKSPPDLTWLDYSSISLPASEVGGDYFEYFSISPSQLAIVIGDVAGHGVASGLVLSGVRSGLYLLQDQLNEPIEVLEKLNRMLRQTAPVRMFVTLQIVLLDIAAHRVVVANAGHPPMIRRRAGRAHLETLGPPGLPLGTGLDPGFRQTSETLDSGDTLVLYTDGLPEVMDFHGNSYGHDRLHREIERASRNDAARQVRDAILNSVSSFKADTTQEDDLTLVVLRIR